MHVTYVGERHWLTVMLPFTLMTMIYQATVSSAPLSSNSVILSYCEAPSVIEGGNATLTCHFDTDLRNTKQGVKVVQYNSQAFEKTVLACLWRFDKVNCIEKYGFTLYGEISNEIRLYIPRVTKEHAGTYACIVFDTEPGIQDKCLLTVVDRPSDPSDTETSFDGCRGNALGCERDRFGALLPMLITTSVLVAVVIILMITVTLIMCKRNASRQPVRPGDIPYKTIK